ncbi:winged helix-turn-helix domain-containing protein [Kitasatospora sp. NPDC059571]|uniref:winged helix-turn-helix domain-containing protein n=1 Tax=Kitasatospora sp. NPDC059571 TaxID=3346871 RepID=UPI00368A3951
MDEDRSHIVDPTRPTYVYQQVADDIAQQIASGRLAPGAMLPAERDLATQYGVAYLTARRAVRELRGRGLVVTLPAKGTYVVKQGAT